MNAHLILVDKLSMSDLSDFFKVWNKFVMILTSLIEDMLEYFSASFSGSNVTIGAISDVHLRKAIQERIYRIQNIRQVLDDISISSLNLKGGINEISRIGCLVRRLYDVDDFQVGMKVRELMLKYKTHTSRSVWDGGAEHDQSIYVTTSSRYLWTIIIIKTIKSQLK